MKNFSLLTILLSIRALLEKDDTEQALKLVNEIIDEIRMGNLLDTLWKEQDKDK